MIRLLFLIGSVLCTCTLFTVDCKDNEWITFKVDNACKDEYFPHLNHTDFRFGMCFPTSNGWSAMSMSASCFSKSNDGDIIVYSGTVRSAVDHNTDDIMVHFEPQEITCKYNMSDAVVSISQAIQPVPDSLT